jgi:hypothetical protein
VENFQSGKNYVGSPVPTYGIGHLPFWSSSHMRYLSSWAKKTVSPGLCDIAEDAVAQPTELAFRVVVGLGLNELDHKARHQRLATLGLQRQGLLKLNRSTIRGKQEGGGLIFCSHLCFTSLRPPRFALFYVRI